MTEHGFIRAVHKYLPLDIFRWKIHDTFAGGVPDAFYAGPASTLFVEYKYVKTLPKRDASLLRTSLSPQQKQWLNTLADFHQPVALIIGCEQLALVMLNKTWNTEPSRTQFLSQAVTFSEVAKWIESTCSLGMLRPNHDLKGRACSSI